MYKEIQICRVDTTTHIELFYYEEGLCAGFPSPAEEYMEMVLDLNKLLIHNPFRDNLPPHHKNEKIKLATGTNITGEIISAA